MELVDSSVSVKLIESDSGVLTHVERKHGLRSMELDSCVPVKLIESDSGSFLAPKSKRKHGLRSMELDSCVPVKLIESDSGSFLAPKSKRKHGLRSMELDSCVPVKLIESDSGSFLAPKSKQKHGLRSMELDSCVPVKLIESDSESDSGFLAPKRKQRKKNIHLLGSCSTMMSKHIPEDLIVEILPFLPVNSLLRFRALSKDIGTVINSNICQFLKLIFSDKSENKLHVCDVNLSMKKRKILHLGKSSYASQKFQSYSYCKGLILLKLSDELFGLTLWNPFTNNYKDLPHCPAVNEGFELFSTTLLGLVYDDYTNDYKAFISVSYRRNNNVQIHYEDQVWVYELKSNIWRKVENNNRFKSHGIGCFTNGSLHWLSENDQKTRQIDAFDVRKETFYLVPLPNCKINKINGVKAELHDLEGCLCISYFRNNMHFQADLYMRKKDEEVDDDDDDQFTWIQLYSTTILPSDLIKIFLFGTIKIWGYPKTGDGDDKEKILFHLGNKDYIVFYNLERKTFGKVKIVDKDPTWVAPFFCIESLVLGLTLKD